MEFYGNRREGKGKGGKGEGWVVSSLLAYRPEVEHSYLDAHHFFCVGNFNSEWAFRGGASDLAGGSGFINCSEGRVSALRITVSGCASDGIFAPRR